MLVVGNGHKKVEEAANKFGVPLDLIQEAEGFGPESIEPYPDNIQVIEIFMDMLTQWRPGPSGVIGLVYEALPMSPRYRRVSPEDEDEIFDCLRIMERAAILAMRENG